MGESEKKLFLFLLGWVLVWDLPDLMDWRRGKVRKTRLWTAGKEKESCLAEEKRSRRRIQGRGRTENPGIVVSFTLALFCKDGKQISRSSFFFGKFLLGYMVFTYPDFKATLSLSRPGSSTTQNPQEAMCTSIAAEERAAPKSHSAPLKKSGKPSVGVCM